MEAPLQVAHQFSTDPILERKTDMCGIIAVYPPDAEPHLWGSLPWKLTTERMGQDGPLTVHLAAKYVSESFERPWFINAKHMFSEPLDQ